MNRNSRLHCVRPTILTKESMLTRATVPKDGTQLRVSARLTSRRYCPTSWLCPEHEHRDQLSRNRMEQDGEYLYSSVSNMYEYLLVEAMRTRVVGRGDSIGISLCAQLMARPFKVYFELPDRDLTNSPGHRRYVMSRRPSFLLDLSSNLPCPSML